MLNRFKYLIVGTAVISSFALTLLAMPSPVSNAKMMEEAGCKQVIEDNGDSCSFVNKYNGKCWYYCVDANRWVSRTADGEEEIYE
jgi:hypothetical protein